MEAFLPNSCEGLAGCRGACRACSFEQFGFSQGPGGPPGLVLLHKTSPTIPLIPPVHHHSTTTTLSSTQPSIPHRPCRVPSHFGSRAVMMHCAHAAILAQGLSCRLNGFGRLHCAHAAIFGSRALMLHCAHAAIVAQGFDVALCPCSHFGSRTLMSHQWLWDCIMPDVAILAQGL